MRALQRPTHAMDNCFQLLRRAGFRLSAGRLAVLQVLQSANGTALSCEQIYLLVSHSGQPLNYSSVQRALTDLERVHLICRAPSATRKRLFQLSVTSSGKLDDNKNDSYSR